LQHEDVRLGLQRPPLQRAWGLQQWGLQRVVTMARYAGYLRPVRDAILYRRRLGWSCLEIARDLMARGLVERMWDERLANSVRYLLRREGQWEPLPWWNNDPARVADVSAWEEELVLWLRRGGCRVRG
jgi:hypothetical protein